MKDLLESITKSSLDDENEIDIEEHPLIAEFQAKYNELNERYVSLKATTDSLKVQIEEEKNRWQKELKETVQIEKQFKKQQRRYHEMLKPDESEMKRKYEIFRDFLFFTQSTENIEQLAKKNSYQQWLNEFDNECSVELEKIQKSLTALKPLREMASKWKSVNFISDLKASGDTEFGKVESNDSFQVIKTNDDFNSESGSGII